MLSNKNNFILINIQLRFKMKKKEFNNIIQNIENDVKSKDNIEKLTKGHHDQALEYFDQFHQSFMRNLEIDMKQIKNALNVELARTVRKLEFKLKGGYSTSFSQNIKKFDLQGFISKQLKLVQKAVNQLKAKIYQYINQFSNQILSSNIERTQEVSLFNFSNTIKSLDDTWKSATSRCPLNKAEVIVKGFNRPQTSWLALGVSKKMKEYGPVKNSLGKQDFMGNIYLNGTNDLAGGYKLKRDLNQGNSFIVTCENRMVWVNRKKEARNKHEVFIMEDNVNYYIYVAIRGPIQLTFLGQ